MESMKVKELMVPLAEYATVSEEATLYEAILALEEAQKRFNRERDSHRAILVLDRDARVVGKLSQWDVLEGIEPSYKKVGELRETSRYGFSPEYIKGLLDDYGLWRKPLDDLCRKAADMNVKHIMCTPGAGEYVQEDASVDEAIHQLVMGHHQSLLVTRGEQIVGILRLIDVFREIARRIRTCRT